MNELQKMLRKARFEADLTIKEAAIGLGISASHLHGIERGNIPRPKMATLTKLSQFYNLNHDDLCIAATRIPSDAFYKVVRKPELLRVIREYPDA